MMMMMMSGSDESVQIAWRKSIDVKINPRIRIRRSRPCQQSGGSVDRRRLSGRKQSSSRTPCWHHECRHRWKWDRRRRSGKVEWATLQRTNVSSVIAAAGCEVLLSWFSSLVLPPPPPLTVRVLRTYIPCLLRATLSAAARRALCVIHIHSDTDSLRAGFASHFMYESGMLAFTDILHLLVRYHVF